MIFPEFRDFALRRSFSVNPIFVSCWQSSNQTLSKGSIEDVLELIWQYRDHWSTTTILEPIKNDSFTCNGKYFALDNGCFLFSCGAPLIHVRVCKQGHNSHMYQNNNGSNRQLFSFTISNFPWNNTLVDNAYNLQFVTYYHGLKNTFQLKLHCLLFESITNPSAIIQ